MAIKSVFPVLNEILFLLREFQDALNNNKPSRHIENLLGKGLAANSPAVFDYGEFRIEEWNGFHLLMFHRERIYTIASSRDGVLDGFFDWVVIYGPEFGL